MTCVFAGDQIHGAQYFQRPMGDVTEVPDGCGDEKEHQLFTSLRLSG